ncbi:unnamed protein product [Dicrocoelium dendriticum]|nr:unnamed protein product [Dicrocoelium dendriticum]
MRRHRAECGRLARVAAGPEIEWSPVGGARAAARRSGARSVPRGGEPRFVARSAGSPRRGVAGADARVRATRRARRATRSAPRAKPRAPTRTVAEPREDAPCHRCEPGRASAGRPQRPELGPRGCGDVGRRVRLRAPRVPARAPARDRAQSTKRGGRAQGRGARDARFRESSGGSARRRRGARARMDRESYNPRRHTVGRATRDAATDGHAGGRSAHAHRRGRAGAQRTPAQPRHGGTPRGSAAPRGTDNYTALGRAQLAAKAARAAALAYEDTAGRTWGARPLVRTAPRRSAGL